MDSNEIKKKILEEISNTEEQIRVYKDMTKPIALDVSIGRISRMDAINNKSVTESVLRQAEEKLKKLKYVLSKVGSPDFGICLKCKKTIPIGRILIKIESAYCVNCAI